MPFAVLIIGAVLIVAAFNNTQADLATALKTDLAGFFAWAAAITIILGIGFIPGLKNPSRYLLGLVVTVIVLTNYKSMLAGLSDFTQTAAAQTAAGAGPPVPTAAFPDPSQQQSPTLIQAVSAKFGLDPLNPISYVEAFSGFGTANTLGI